MTGHSITKFLMSCVLAIMSLCAGTSVFANETEREGGLTGTGIVGEIKALGSIIVNGQRITFDPDLSVRNDLGTKRADALVPGEIVAVAVEPDAQDWRATAISQVHALIGPVSESQDDRFTVLGTEVHWQSQRPTTGEWVAVSGFWAGPAVVATHVAPTTPQQTASIQGSYGLGLDGTTFMVGSLELDLDPLKHATEGDVIRVKGTLESGAFAVTDVHLGLFDEPVLLVLAEGYLTNVAPSGHYTVAGSGLSGYTSNHEAEMPSDRVTVCGVSGRLAPQADLTEAELARKLGCQ